MRVCVCVQARRSLEVEKEELISKVKELSELNDESSRRLSRASSLEMEQRSSLQNQLAAIRQELEDVRAQSGQEIEGLKASLAHEVEMRQVEKEMAVKLNAVRQLK